MVDIFVLMCCLQFLVSSEARCAFDDTAQRIQIYNIYPAEPLDDETTVYNGTDPIADRQRNVRCNNTYPYVYKYDAACISGYFRYVLPSGICNNLKKPLQGASYSQYKRLVLAAYGEEPFSFRRDANNYSLSPERRISNAISDIDTYNGKPLLHFNHLGLLYSLFVEIDSSQSENFVPSFGDNKRHCCAPDNTRFLPLDQRHPGCHNIDGNTLSDPFATGCVNFVRSEPIFQNSITADSSQIMNPVTNYLDLSTIYGSTPQIQRSLRLYRDGAMLFSENRILPRKPNCIGAKCYYGATSNSVLFPTLTQLHSLHLRMHNIFASQLLAVNSHWDDERTFQETRRLLTAVYQSITYNEWLPMVLDEEAFRRNITCGRSQTFCGLYDATVDARASEEYTSSIRSFHMNFPLSYNLYDSNYRQTASFDMAGVTQDHMSIVDTHFVPLIRGLLADTAVFDILPDFMRTFKLHKLDDAIDVFAYDIARARDHGVASYAVYFEWCFGTSIDDWNDLAEYAGIAESSISVLQTLYPSPRDVDLNVGVYLEAKNDRMFGKVTKCLLGDQFYRSKHGDRYFYSLSNQANPFSAAQLHSIHRLTFADFLCLTTDLEAVQPKAFEPIGPRNRLKTCAPRQIDFKLWHEPAEP